MFNNVVYNPISQIWNKGQAIKCRFGLANIETKAYQIFLLSISDLIPIWINYDLIRFIIVLKISISNSITAHMINIRRG